MAGLLRQRRSKQAGTGMQAGQAIGNGGKRGFTAGREGVEGSEMTGELVAGRTKHICATKSCVGWRCDRRISLQFKDNFIISKPGPYVYIF